MRILSILMQVLLLGISRSFLRLQRAVFVTNAVVHAQTLAGRGFKVLLVGGELKSTTEAVIGNRGL